jgi:ATP-dependent helicase/nuclease subunit A
MSETTSAAPPAAPERPLDPGVLQRRASDPRAHAWVSASAGSGKTKVLTDRVLRLLLGDAETPPTAPHRILAITFTKAAAAEMAGRIVDTLAAWATIEDEALTRALFALTGERPPRELRARARRLFTRVLDEAGGLQIQTIHSFCQSLIARFPLESGIAPGFRLMEETEAATLMANARDDVLRLAENGNAPVAQAIAALAGMTTVPTLVDLMAAFANKEARWRAAIAYFGSLDAAIEALAQACDAPRGETVESLQHRAMQDAAFDGEALRAAAAILSRSGGKDPEKGAVLADWLAAASATRLEHFDAYRAVFLTKDGDIRSTLANKGAAAAIPALQAEAQRLFALREAQQRVQLFRASEAALRFADAVLARYRARKAQGALLDYDDLIRAAVDLLERQTVPGWVMYKLDGGIDHVLVDEAQDTNEAQWRILSRLTAEFMAGEGARGAMRTIFAVGDEKQSIFSFQGADPSVFVKMQDFFAARAREALQPFAPVDLNISFRSTGAVLSGVDAVFAKAMAREGVTGASDTVIRHIAQRRGMGGRIELWPLAPRGAAEEESAWESVEDADPAPGAEERLARIIAAAIADWIRRGERLPARGRAIRAGDILVLMRRRTGFANALVRGLKARGVPVAGIDRMVLKDQLAVQDLLAVLGVLLLPEDDLTLASVLKSPLIGFDEDELFALAQARPGLLWSALRDAALDGDRRADSVVTYLSALRREADLLAPYALLQQVLDTPCPADPAGSGRRALLARLGEEALDPLKELLNTALAFSDTQTPSLQGFLAWVEKGGVEIKRETESGVSDTVRLMTVHAAKGLQAPIVFLADTVSVPQQSEMLGWTETDPPLPLWAARSEEGGARLAAARARGNAVRDAEYRRLLYVAMTRAADRLIVCGWQPGGREALPERCWYTLVRNGLAGLAVETPFDFRGLHRDGWEGTGLVYDEPQTAPPETDRAAAAAADDSAIPPLPAWARREAPTEPTPSRPLRPSHLLEDEPGVRSPLSGEDRTARFQRGTLIHRLLEFLPDLPPPERAAAAARFLALPGHKLSQPQQRAIAREVETVLNDPAFAAVFSPASRAEVPIVGLVGRLSVAGQVDRLLVEAERVLVVDYKTNRPPPATEDTVDPAYRRQMAAYRAVLAAIYPDKRIDCALLWTDGPRLMPLSAALLDAEGIGP